MNITLIATTKEIDLIFEKNQNNKYKMANITYNVSELVGLLFESIVQNNLQVQLGNVVKQIKFNKIEYANLVYLFLTDQINLNAFNKELSLTILKHLIQNSLIQEQEVETRFFTDIFNNKLNTSNYNFFEINLKGKNITTDLLKVLINYDGMYNISFNSEYIEDLKLSIGEKVEITTSKNQNIITKQLEITNFYYDELNQCYFISGKNVQ